MERFGEPLADQVAVIKKFHKTISAHKSFISASRN
jgi:hypothetical protein